MGRVAVILLSASLGLSSAFLVACGDRNNLIPSRNADAIKSKLDSVTDAIAAGRCAQAVGAASRAQDEVQKLPGGLDPKLRSNVDSGVARVASQAQTQCMQSTTTRSTQSQTTPTPTTPSTTASTHATPTETQPMPSAPASNTTPSDTTPSNGGTPPGGADGAGGAGNGD
jgi:hypothetical protein